MEETSLNSYIVMKNCCLSISIFKQVAQTKYVSVVITYGGLFEYSSPGTSIVNFSLILTKNYYS